jgi:hypothetical protein
VKEVSNLTGFLVFGVIVAIVLVTSLFKNVTMSTMAKNAIAAVLSVVAGVVFDLSTHGFDFGTYAAADIMGTVLVIYGGAQAFYQFILKGTALDAKLEDVGGPKPEEEPVEDTPREGF